MIYRVRLEGGSGSSDELEREFRLLASQIAFVAAFEGVGGRESTRGKTTIESRDRYDDESLVRLSGGTFGFEYEGRHVFEMSPLEGRFDVLQPLPQPEYEVFWIPAAMHHVEMASRPGNLVQSVASPPDLFDPPPPGGDLFPGRERERQDEVLVLRRMNGKPGPRSSMAAVGASELLTQMGEWPGVDAVAAHWRDGEWTAQAHLKPAASGEHDRVEATHESLDEAAGLLWEKLAERLNQPVPAPPPMP